MTKKHIEKIINKLVEESFRDGKLIESQVLKSIKILRNQPTSQAILALSEYLRQLKRKQKQHTMYIETVIPPPTKLVQKMKKVINKKTKITKVVTSINPDILGGFKLRVGDEIWDQSILGKLNQVKEAIVHV